MVSRRRVIRGIPISSGIALGHTHIVLPGLLDVAEKPIAAAEVDAELAALDKAVAATARELQKLRVSAGRNMAGSVSKVFDAQLLIATDQTFIDRVKEQISERRRNAAFVYNLLIRESTHQLAQSENPYLRQSAEEITAVGDRILSRLAGVGEKSTVRLDANTVLVARIFSPGDILAYKQRRAAAFLVEEGGNHSHMALIARSLLMPMVMAPDMLSKVPGHCRIIVDGTNGIAIINPTQEDCAEYQKRKRRQGPATVKRIKKLTKVPPETSDGTSVEVAANLEFPGPADEILASKKIPVGLYRTEFLYLELGEAPDELGQFRYYDRIAERFAKSHVIFRTFDLGSDKVVQGEIPSEQNPALGWRGIRLMLEMPEVFKTQIRAILRASTRRNISILLPMVSEIGELRKARRLISQAMLELRREGETFDDRIRIGVMIEVPAAALTAEPLVANADFVSIGTNDLSQYTMAADRGNPKVADLYNPYHPSVLHLINRTVSACRKYNRPVSICGEMAGDALAIPLFVGMRVSSLSMNPGRVVNACRTISRLNTDWVTHLVEPVLSSPSAVSVVRKLQNFKNAIENK